MNNSYVAGFIDGEGCISISHRVTKKGRQIFQLTIQTSNTDIGILEMLQKQFGGYITNIKTRSPKHNQAFRWLVADRKAYKLLKTIKDLLIIKREQALLAIDYYDTLIGKGVIGEALTESMVKRRLGYAHSLKLMHRRIN